jgi:hypothetical protein
MDARKFKEFGIRHAYLFPSSQRKLGSMSLATRAFPLPKERWTPAFAGATVEIFNVKS